MNKKKFEKSIYDVLNSYDVNLKFVTSWYQNVVNTLKQIKEKGKNIKHPRHLGDFLEDEVSKVINDLLPQQYILGKGFVLNNFSALSQEQDILVIDGSLGSSICKTDQIGYYPVESVIASIEIKSDLNLLELRKCLVSCVSVKKLCYAGFDYVDKQDKRLFYGIFAYTSSCKEESFEKELSECIKSIPESLRPNMIYILDQGLYFPTKDDLIYFDLEVIQKTEEEYKIIKNSANENIESQNFILFFSTLIDHAFHQSKKRQPAKYSDYVLNPIVWETKIKETRNSDTPIRKFINNCTRWSEEEHASTLLIFEEKCNVCEIEYKFYKLPPGTKIFRTELEKNLKKEGCYLLPKNKKFVCSCGESLTIEEAL